MRKRITPFLTVCFLMAFAFLSVYSLTALALELSDEAKAALEADAKEKAELEAQAEGDATGTDPRYFSPKFMPYYRYTELENGLEQQELVAFGLLRFSQRAALTYEIPLAFKRDVRNTALRDPDTGICAGKEMIACVTTGASEDSCSHSGREGDTRLHLWPILFSFRYLSFDVLEPEILHGVGGVAFMEGDESGLSTLDAYANRWAAVLETLSSRPLVQYNRDHDFDETKRLVSGAPVYSPFVRHRPDAIPQ